MTSEQRYFQDDSYLETREKEKTTEEVQKLLDQYKELTIEDRINFNRLLRQSKLFY